MRSRTGGRGRIGRRLGAAVVALGAALVVAAGPAVAADEPAPPKTPTLVSPGAGAPVPLEHDAEGWYWQVTLKGADAYVATWERAKGTWPSADEAQRAVANQNNCYNQGVTKMLDSYATYDAFVHSPLVKRDTKGELTFDWDTVDDRLAHCSSTSEWKWSRTPSKHDKKTGVTTVRIPLSLLGPGRHDLFVLPLVDKEHGFVHNWSGEGWVRFHSGLHSSVFGKPLTFTVVVPTPVAPGSGPLLAQPVADDAWDAPTAWQRLAPWAPDLAAPVRRGATHADAASPSTWLGARPPSGWAWVVLGGVAGVVVAGGVAWLVPVLSRRRPQPAGALPGPVAWWFRPARGWTWWPAAVVVSAVGAAAVLGERWTDWALGARVAGSVLLAAALVAVLPGVVGRLVARGADRPRLVLRPVLVPVAVLLTLCSLWLGSDVVLVPAALLALGAAPDTARGRAARAVGARAVVTAAVAVGGAFLYAATAAHPARTFADWSSISPSLWDDWLRGLDAATVVAGELGAVVAVVGATSLVVSLLPFDGFDGAHLWRAHRAWWAVAQGFAAAVAGLVVVIPGTGWGTALAWWAVTVAAGGAVGWGARRADPDAPVRVTPRAVQAVEEPAEPDASRVLTPASPDVVSRP